MTGRHRAYGYCHSERFLSQLAKANGSEALTTALGSWTIHLWEAENQDVGEEAPRCFYIDGHRKPVYADCLLPRGLIGRSGKILGNRALVLLHDQQGYPRLATTSRGDQHLTAGLPHVLARYEQAGGKTAHARIIVDREGMAAPFLRDLAQAGHTVVSLLYRFFSELLTYKVAPPPWVQQKRRGRPRRRPLPDPSLPKRSRGRPRKVPLSTFTA